MRCVCVCVCVSVCVCVCLCVCVRVLDALQKRRHALLYLRTLTKSVMPCQVTSMLRTLGKNTARGTSRGSPSNCLSVPRGGAQGSTCSAPQATAETQTENPAETQTVMFADAAGVCGGGGVGAADSEAKTARDAPIHIDISSAPPKPR
jgi:hypothetical protein